MKLPEFKEKMHDLGYVSKIININPDYDLVFVKVIEVRSIKNAETLNNK